MTEYTRIDRLYARAVNILERRENGFGGPILEYLAHRGVTNAMVALGCYFDLPGGFAVPSSDRGLNRRAWRRGDPTGASNLAVDCFNRRDLQGYRMWLHRAARAGDPYSARELKRFETRLPHGDAKKIRRGRPYRRYDHEVLD